MPKKKARTTTTAPADGGDDGALVAQTARPKALRGKRGGLKDLPNMPFDILLEVFSHLNPRDLLQLARTSQDFRALLMKRTSGYLWKAARQNVESFPDCPPYLSEPEYANLAFFPYCHVCLKNNIPTVLWEFNVRYCNDCKKKYTHESTYGLPVGFLRKIPYDLDVLNRIRGRRYRFIYHVPQVEAFLTAWKAIAGDEEAERKLIKEQGERVKEIREHSELCNQWTKLRMSSRASELDDVRQARLESIISRLRDMGWEEELDILATKEYFPLANHVHARPAKPLTNRGWQKISEELVEYMRELKSMRLAKLHGDRLRSRLTHLVTMVSEFYAENPRTPETECMPRVADFALMPEFQAIADVPDDVNVTAADFRALQPDLPRLAEQWQNKVKADLTLLLVEELSSANIPDGVNLFDLAVAWFQCDKCTEVMRYPNIVAHSCTRPYYYRLYDSPDYKTVAYELEHCLSWSISSFSCHPTVVRARGIVLACGKDPDTTTVQDMDELDARLWWKDPMTLDSRRVMGWRLAMKSKWTSGMLALERNWEVVNQKVANKVKEVELQAEPTLRIRHEQRRHWCCSLCSRGGNRYIFTQAQLHMRNIHSIEDATVENGRIYLHPDGKPLLPQSVVVFNSSLIKDEDLAWDEQELFQQGRACFCDY